MSYPDDRDPDLLHVAFLLSKGIPQTRIARLLDLSPSKVSRLASKAIAARILEPQHPVLALPPDEVKRIENELNHSDALIVKMERRSQGRCKHVEVVYPRSPYPRWPDSDAERRSYVREVAAGAARFLLAEMLPRMRNVGLTWGVGVGELCRELAPLLARQTGASSLKNALTFHQCTGDTLAVLDDPSRRASTMVAELNHVLGTHGDTFSIGAAIPKGFDAELVTIRRYIASSPGYSAMFRLSRDSGIELHRDLDAIITGCGDASELDSWRDECAAAAGIEPDALTDMVVGNVGGTWIPKSPRFEAEVDEINHRWNGVSVSDLRRTVERGREVILVAAEPPKASVVVRAIELGYVSTLIASSDLVQKILEAPSDLSAGGRAN